MQCYDEVIESCAVCSADVVRFNRVLLPRENNIVLTLCFSCCDSFVQFFSRHRTTTQLLHREVFGRR